VLHSTEGSPRAASRRPLFSRLSVRILVILGALALAGWHLADNHRETGSIVPLGLDLQGGIHLVLGIDDPGGTMSPEARADAIERSRRIVLNRVDALGVAEPIVQVVGRDRLVVELAGITDEARARELIGRTAMLEWRMVRPLAEIEPALERIDRAARSGSEEGTPNPSNSRPFTSLLHSAGIEGEYLVHEDDLPRARALLEEPAVRAALPRGLDLRWGWEPVDIEGRRYRTLVAVDAQPFLTGEALEDARTGRDPETNRALVHFDLSRAGGRVFGDRTGRNIGERMAILLDGEVVSAPVIQARIGSSGVIQLGPGDMEAARDLALVLRAGALPAPLRILEERTVGPSLGQDSIDQGRLAGIAGLALVVLLMVAYYRMAGVLAVVALSAYVVLLLGGLAALNATLTLPGIAGIILSIGMAVDANVLIFERIREELDGGVPAGAAVEVGFARAFSAILDANVTTLVTALVLFQLGTGPVRGFAVTLSMGIVASFFTALYLTRTLFILYLRGAGAGKGVKI